MRGIVQLDGALAFAGGLRRAQSFGDAVLDRHRLGERPPRRLILEQPISDEAVPVAVKGRLEGMEIMARSAGFGGAHPIVETNALLEGRRRRAPERASVDSAAAQRNANGRKGPFADAHAAALVQLGRAAGGARG